MQEDNRDSTKLELPEPLRNRLLLRRWLISPSALIASAVAVAFLAFLLTGFDFEFDETLRNIRSSNLISLLIAVALFYIAIPIRGYRWRILMKNAGIFDKAEVSAPSIKVHSEMILINYFTNSIAWLRLGDAYRAFLMSSQYNVGFSGTVGTVISERILTIGVSFFLLLIAGIGLLQTDYSETIVRITAIAFIVFAVVGTILIIMRFFGLRLARLLPNQVEVMYGHFQEGALGSFRQLPSVILITCLIGLLSAARLYFVVNSLGIDLDLALILFASLASALLLIVPIPGGLGLVDLGLLGILVLSPTLVLPEATAITLVDRSITYLSVIVIGGGVFIARQTIAKYPAAELQNLPKH